MNKNIVLTIDTCPVQSLKYDKTIIPREMTTSCYKYRSDDLALAIPAIISFSSRSYSGLS
jgi:hypothetical protein